MILSSRARLCLKAWLSSSSSQAVTKQFEFAYASNDLAEAYLHSVSISSIL